MALLLYWLFILQVFFVFVSTDERPCTEGNICVPLSHCHVTAKFDGFLFPCHFGLRYVCCPPSMTNYAPANTETRKTNLFPENCGVIADEDKISGGEEANLGQFPWMALLGYRQRSIDFLQFLCGGSLITDQYVLTAAHCLHLGKSYELILVRLGELDLSTEKDCITFGSTQVCGEKHIDVLVDRMIAHENFNDQTYQNDIGLIKLKSRVRFTEYIIPVCLPFERNFENQDFAKQNFTVSGWGKTNSAALGGSQKLLYAKVGVWNQSHCNDSVPPQVKPITTYQICASGHKKEDACKGDSGGPLFNVTMDTDDQFRNFQLGVVSFASTFTCGNPELPTVYTRVDKYLNWIVDNVS